MSNEAQTYLIKNLQAIVKKMGVNFSIKNKRLTCDNLLSDEGVLPGLIKRADNLAKLCLGYGLGAQYEDAEDTLLGFKFSLDNATPTSIRLLFIVDVLCEFVERSPSRESVALDEILYD